MELKFEKWHGSLNDFILLWLSQGSISFLIPSFQRQAPSLCSKKGNGIGADAILLIETPLDVRQKTLKLTIINKDGSLAKNCGNGLRCAALSAKEKLKLEDFVIFDVDGRSFLCDLDQTSRMVTVAMDASPLDLNGNLQESLLTLKKEYPKLFQECSLWNIGNPHLVSFLDDWPQDKELLERAGAYAQTCFLEGINVHFVSTNPRVPSIKESKEVQGQTEEALDVYVYERGVGPTNACGSGACAVALSLLDKGLSDRSLWVTISMTGGALYVMQKAKGETARVKGPGEFVFHGNLFL